MDKNHYFVKLTLVAGEYEKTLKHLVQADDITTAFRAAIKAEAHGELEWQEGQISAADMGWEFFYKPLSCEQVKAEDLPVLKKFLHAH